MINGNPTLTDSYGQFVSDERKEWDEVCRQAAQIAVSGKEWRNGVLPLLSRAERIIYPCRDLYQRFSRLYGNESELWQSRRGISPGRSKLPNTTADTCSG